MLWLRLALKRTLIWSIFVVDGCFLLLIVQSFASTARFPFPAAPCVLASQPFDSLLPLIL